MNIQIVKMISVHDWDGLVQKRRNPRFKNSLDISFGHAIVDDDKGKD